MSGGYSNRLTNLEFRLRDQSAIDKDVEMQDAKMDVPILSGPTRSTGGTAESAAIDDDAAADEDEEDIGEGGSVQYSARQFKNKAKWDKLKQKQLQKKAEKAAMTAASDPRENTAIKIGTSETNDERISELMTVISANESDGNASERKLAANAITHEELRIRQAYKVSAATMDILQVEKELSRLHEQRKYISGVNPFDDMSVEQILAESKAEVAKEEHRAEVRRMYEANPAKFMLKPQWMAEEDAKK